MKHFWSKISPEPNSGCWLWAGHIKPNGYGEQRVKGRLYLAHRLSWFLHFGDIPPGLLVCHRCDNRACVCPTHLILGSHQDNHDDMTKKGRRKTPPNVGITHCSKGHQFSNGNTYRHGRKRVCRECQRRAAREYQRRKARQKSL